MKKSQLHLLFAVVVLATGCPKYRPSVNFEDTQNLAKRINKHFENKQKEYFSASLVKSDDATAKKIRNELIEETLPYIDVAYENFINGLAVGRDRTNFVADVIELSTSAAVGITKGERPIQILGVVLTAFRGGRRSSDLNFYKDYTTPILITKMDGNRARVRKAILTREREEVSTYPIGAAISDIVAYYNAGTLVRAFTELQKDTTMQTRESEDDVLILKGVPLTRPTTREEVEEAKEALSILGAIATSLEMTASAEERAAGFNKMKNIIVALEKDKDAAPLLKIAEITSQVQENEGKKLLDGLRRIRRNLATDDKIHRIINRAIIANAR